ncbi:MAG: Na/Pi cotransporter family protein, partial [Clostridia bacterium]|nr:Na/Pi cotransporter family protein [Clostridia bacterium]
FLVPLWILKDQVAGIFATISGDVGQQIAIFHTLFNVLTTLVLLPFSQYVVKLACILIPEKQVEDSRFKLEFIDNRLLETPPIAASYTKKEIVRMGKIALSNINSAIEMLLDDKVNNVEEIKSNEEVLNYLNKSITAYLTKLMGKDLSDENDKKIGSYYHVVSDLERVGDYAENIMEYSIRLRNEEMSFSEGAVEELKKVTAKINSLYEKAITAFDDRDVSMLCYVEEIEEEIDELSVELESRHIDRVKQGACTAQLGSIYLQTISNLERVGDHITNVAFSIRHYRREHKAVNSSN